MFMVHVRVEPGIHEKAPQGADANALHRHILQRATATEGLQHVYVCADEREAGVDLILFVSQPSLWAAESVAHKLVLECLGARPGWTVSHCGVTLPGALAAALLLGEGNTLPRQPPDAEEC
ncbi:hypothetical protein [Streptomyces sp. NPDC059168]|uniref:hypothetical protein n=1 Tax=Streptomyces sp. NPDC059168 TaxID=3346753 RepID=UPI0036A71AE4